MTRVKICGITSLRDALAAADAGADALGFNFWSGSPRFIDPKRAACIIQQLPPLVTPVGLFVNETPARVKRLAKQAGVTTVQLHGDEPPAMVQQLAGAGLTVIKVFSVGDGFSVSGIGAYQKAHAFLLDTQVRGLRGGTGKTFDWAKAKSARRYGRVILAGGLAPGNVARAIRAARPYAVDVSSGVEKRPGVKDHEKVRQFIRRAKGVRF